MAFGMAVALAMFASVVVPLVIEVRRSRRLNRIAHEVRRPLQALALTLEPGSGAVAHACIEQTNLALADLDDVINGRRLGLAPVPMRLLAVTSALAERWGLADVEVLRPSAEADTTVLADPARLGAALDNLVANGLAHGSGPVEVRASSIPGEVTIEVRDGGPSGDGRADSDPRHGHGLRIAADGAAGCGGRLVGPVPAEGGTTLAAIVMPAFGSEPSG